MPRFAHRLLVCLLGASIMFGLVAGSASAAGSTQLTEAQAQQIGTDAYVYGIPLLEFLRQQQTQTSVTVPNRLSDAPINQLGNQRNLADAAHQVFVAPNNDTLYSMAHVDLSRGPLVLHVPKVAHHHYYVFEFLDPYTNVFHYVGTRTTGDGAGNYAIVGPHFHGKLPAGVHRITSRYEHIWLCGRTLVNGPADLGAVHRIQDGFKLVPLKAFERVGLSYRAPRPQRIVTTHTAATLPTGLAFFDALGTALAHNPAPARDHAILHELAQVGIGRVAIPPPSTSRRPPWPDCRPRQRPVPGRSSRCAPRSWRSRWSSTTAGTWPRRTLATSAPTTRCARWCRYTGSPPTSRSRRCTRWAASTAPGPCSNGAHRYVIHVPASEIPPVRYYWSFTAYNTDLYLVRNPINRYAINQFTPGVKYNHDGSLDIYVQATAPAGHESNWLPSPSSGQFEVILRMYGPKKSVLDGAYKYPAITAWADRTEHRRSAPGPGPGAGDPDRPGRA